MSEEREVSQSRRQTLSLVAFGLVTMTTLSVQIVASRLFGMTVGYFYAFMIVSLAMLGLAVGGLIVHLASSVFSPPRFHVHAAALSVAMGLLFALGILAFLYLYPHAEHGFSFLSLGVLFWCLFPSLLCSGTVVSLVLKHNRSRFAFFYGIDLVCAAIGCLLATWLLSFLSPVEASFRVLAIVPILGGILFALSGRARVTAVLGVLAALAVLAGAHVIRAFPDLTMPRHISWLERPRIVVRSNSFSSITAYPGSFFTWSLSATYRGPRYRMADVIIDGVGGTELVGFDGSVEALRNGYEYLDYDMTSLGHLLVPPSGRQLIIGPGAGVDILQAVRAGRTDITAVELNGLMRSVVNDDLGEFSGRPYELPGVNVHIENGRTFIKRSTEKFDLITLTWVDTGGSTIALAGSENYLYTVEAYQEYLQHLSPNGAFAFMRALGTGEALRTDSARGIAVAMEALRREHVPAPEDHIMALASQSPYFPRPMCYVLLKRSTFTLDEVNAAKEFAKRMNFYPIWLPGQTSAPTIPDSPDGAGMLPFMMLDQSIIRTHDPEQLYATSALDLEPSTDDRPFYFVERAGAHRAASPGLETIRTCLLILLALALPCLALPIWKLSRRTERIGLFGAAALGYFALLGVAFMMVEMEMFHVFALLLGSPTYALSAVLASMLVFSGAGSLLAGRVATRRRAAMVGGLLVVCLVAFATTKETILASLIGLSLGARVTSTVLVVGALSFLMGFPMALGMRHVRDREDLALWGWALNGLFSVLATVLAMYSGINFGIACTFGIGIVCYALATVLLQLFAHRLTNAESPEPVAATAHPDGC